MEMKKKLTNIGLAAILVIAVFAVVMGIGIASAETHYNESGNYIEGINVSVNTSEDFNRSDINDPLTFQINNTLNATAANFNVTTQLGLTTNATGILSANDSFWVNASSADTYWVNVSNNDNRSEYVNFTVEYSSITVTYYNENGGYIEGINVSVNTSYGFNRSDINDPLTFQINNTLNATAANFNVTTQLGLTTNATGILSANDSFWVNASSADTYWVNVSNNENRSEYVNFTVEYSAPPEEEITTVTIEIKPETLNLASKGVFTAFITNVTDINISTVECEGAPAVRGMASEEDNDTYIVKFNRQDLVGVSPDDEVTLTVTGKLDDGTSFEGNDTIRVIDKRGLGPKLLPSNPFYVVKKSSERVHMFFTFDDDAKARLHIRFSEKRLAEAKAMTELGKPEWAEGLMEDYIGELNETYKCMQRQKQRGRPVMDLAEYVCNATDEHAEILSDFVDEVPGQTKPHIAHAMNASYRGHTRAMSEIAGEKPDRAAQRCAEFAEKRMEKAVEMFEVGRPEHAQRMLQGYNESMEEAEKALKIAEKRGLNVTEIAEHVGNMTYKYKHVKEAGTHGKGRGQK